VESIRILRKKLGLSLGDVSQGSGMKRESIARAERAGIDPKASTLLALARAMKVPVCELYGKEGKHGRSR
jgi:transcriptional regulator with XRE-family HTH domain